MVDPITADPIMEVIRALSRSRLAIGLITFMGLVITQATRITPGEQVIGGRGMVIEAGSTAITSCEDTDPTESLGNRYSNDGLNQAAAGTTKSKHRTQENDAEAAAPPNPTGRALGDAPAGRRTS